MKKRVTSSLIWGWQPCLQKKKSAAEFLSHIFGVSRNYAKSRVGSEGVTGLKMRGRPPRLDDTVVLDLR